MNDALTFRVIEIFYIVDNNDCAKDILTMMTLANPLSIYIELIWMA